MPALVAAPKTSKEESIARKRQILEATQAERLDVLGPHLDLLIRLRAMLPPGSPDIIAIETLYTQVEMTAVETVKKARAVAQWRIRKGLPVIVRGRTRRAPNIPAVLFVLE